MPESEKQIPEEYWKVDDGNKKPDAQAEEIKNENPEIDPNEGAGAIANKPEDDAEVEEGQNTKAVENPNLNANNR